MKQIFENKKKLNEKNNIINLYFILNTNLIL